MADTKDKLPNSDHIFSNTTTWLADERHLEECGPGRSRVSETHSGGGEFRTPGEHQVNGIRFPGMIQLCNLHWLKHDFTFRPDDILIVAYPKSGSTWMQTIVYYILHLEELRLQGRSSLSDCPQVTVEKMAIFLELQHKAPPTGENNGHPRNARIFKTHLPIQFLKETFKRGKPRILVIHRNPKDTLVSFYHFHRMFCALGNFGGSWDDFFTNLVSRDRLVYGPIHEHMIGWSQMPESSPALYISYEDLLTNATRKIRQVAHYLDASITDSDVESLASVTSFQRMKQNPQLNMSTVRGLDHEISPFMRKGAIGDWRNYFSTEQSSFIDPWCQKLIANGIHLNYG